MAKLSHEEMCSIYPTFHNDYYQNFYQWAVDSLEEQCRIDPSVTMFNSTETYIRFMNDYFPYLKEYKHWEYVKKRFSNVFYKHVEEWPEYHSRLPNLFKANNRIKTSKALPIEYFTPRRKATSIITNFVEKEQEEIIEQTELKISENIITEEITQEETTNIVQLPGIVPGKEFNIHIHVSAPLTVEYHDNGLIIS
jgi:hypothetical protein